MESTTTEYVPVNPAPTDVPDTNSTRKGQLWTRSFCPDGVSPWDTVTWERRDATIADAKGGVVFEQRAVEVPATWSQTATNVVVSKYFRGHVGTPDRETSVRQLIGRVVDTIVAWGIDDRYFANDSSAEAFRDDLAWLCLHQHLAFNSPVWFNVGVEARPQCSACFINSVDDTMGSILDLAKTEGMLFKWGSGAGCNLSPIRSSREFLRGGGTASGPVSFMRGFDAFAGVIKSGGKTRRAAKMVILDIAHPDIREFINCKGEEERKARVLIGAGYDAGFNVPGGAYDSVFFQNANHSVRVTDEFMDAVTNDNDWSTLGVTTNEPVDTYRARDLMKEIADAAWACGDPGLQFDTTINEWHTCINTDRIRASNPCSEYMFLDNTACNLSSLNLMKFRDDNGEFEVDRFRIAARTAITAQEILVDRASYPTPTIGENSYKYRPLGLGYANVGALLMARGLPYDSDEGRAYAGAITALMHGEAYAQSARIASDRGAFEGYSVNEDAMLRVVRKHRDAATRLPKHLLPTEMFKSVIETWDDCLALGQMHGYRNSQVTVLAPTGTIGFMMDCDTTGIEPDIALIKYKKLVGGGLMKLVNNTVPEALARLGYTGPEQAAIAAYLETHETIEGAPFMKDEHLAVFDCAFKPRNGVRTIHPLGHIKMMAAAQPFLSGAISKTVNVPEDYTPQDIVDTYMESWRLGLKAVAVYRDGCKQSQPLTTTLEEEDATPLVETRVETVVEYRPVRRKLPIERHALTHKLSVGGHDGYVTVGLYDDGTPGEIFIVMAKEGSTISGLMDAFATAVSLALQYGVPMDILTTKFCHMRFEPSGFTGNQDIPIAKSILDYIFRWLELKFCQKDEEVPVITLASSAETATNPAMAVGTLAEQERTVFQAQADAPPCHACGSMMVRSGSCYKCFNCGATSGCS